MAPASALQPPVTAAAAALGPTLRLAYPPVYTAREKDPRPGPGVLSAGPAVPLARGLGASCGRRRPPPPLRAGTAAGTGQTIQVPHAVHTEVSVEAGADRTCAPTARFQRLRTTTPRVVLTGGVFSQRGGGGIGRGTPPPPGRPAYAQPLSPCRQVPASMAVVTDSNRPQPLWQPPPTACLTAAGAASEVPSLLMQPWGGYLLSLAASLPARGVTATPAPGTPASGDCTAPDRHQTATRCCRHRLRNATDSRIRSAIPCQDPPGTPRPELPRCAAAVRGIRLRLGASGAEF